VGRPEGKRPLGRPKRRLGITLKYTFKKWEGGMDWIDLVQYTERWRALVIAVRDVWVP
jgi:hypothetical protein